MVATVFELKSSAMAVSYFERDGYYAKNDPEHRQASFWHGAAAKDLGLRAHVRPSRFEEVLSGWVPGTDTRLGRMREGEHEHRPGWDITFSAPKSVSLEALVVGDRRVIRAHDEAVRATLDWLEAELLETRGWDPATRRRPRVKADGMVVAGFRHLTSRDQDPQLHTHCVLANMTRNAEGEWRSVEPTKIRRSAKLIGAYYRNELARRLQALGMAVTPRLVGRVPGFELAGYDRSFLEAFSGRRREILARLEKLGLPYTPELAQMAALHTRRRKKDVGLAQLVPAWREKARALGLVREQAALAPPRPIDPLTWERVEVPPVPPPDLPANTLRSMKRAPALPGLPSGGAEGLSGTAAVRSPAPAELSAEPELGALGAVAQAVAHVAERRTAIPEAEIRAVALGHAPGRYALSQIDAAIDRLVKGGELIEVERRGMDRAFVTQWAVRAERRVLAAMRAGRGKGMTLADGETVEKLLAETNLTEGQREAVRTVVLSDDLVIGVQGHAGSGKTTMLREARALLGNTPIHGLAPSAAAARVLEREAGIPSTTLQYFLTRFGDLSDPEALARAREEYAGSVLAVDEASMIDTVRMADLLRIAARLGVARVALVGDTAQLRAVDAGQPFRLLQKAGMRTAAMTEVLRQRDPELLDAVTRSREGEPGAAIEDLGDRVREASREALGYEAARRWLALPPEAREDTLLLAPTHAIRRQANEAVREGLELEGVLHGRVLEIDRLVDRRLTRAQAAEITSYEPGDLAVFHRDHYGCRRDDVCTVTGIEDGMVVLAHPDGEGRRFRPSGNAAWYLRICDTERIELRAGDHIRWTRNRRAPPRRFSHPRAPDLVNGGEAEIVGIDSRRVRFRDADGREFNLALADPQLRHLDHAYCSTVHSAQGRTARAAIAVLEAGGAADRELFHVELSRVSHDFLLLTDDREALVALLEAREGIEEGALEALGVDPVQIPPVDPEVFAALTEDWRALKQRAEETSTLPFFLPGYREVMARAVALSEIEDLPADMRRFVDGMLAEHEAHLARDREVKALTRKIQENWQRWPELGWAASAEGCAVDELPRYADWREEGTALLEEGSRRLAEARSDLRAGDGDAARHLHAMPGALAGLEGAARALERARALDDARRLEPLRREIRGEAVQLLDERRELEERARMAHPSGFAPPTGLQGYADWTERCEALAARWRAHPDARQSGPGGLEDEAAGIAADVDRLEQLRGHDQAWARWFAMRQSIMADARSRNTIPFHVESWDAFVDEARALGTRPGLPEAAAEGVERVLEYDRTCRVVEGFFAGARDHRERWDALQEETARRVQEDPAFSIVDLPDYRPLSSFARDLRETGQAIRDDEAAYRPHLDRTPDGRRTFASAMERLGRHHLPDRFVDVMDRIEETKRGARERGILPFQYGGYRKAIAEAERLAEERELEEAARRRLRAEIEQRAAQLEQWLEIERLLEETAKLELEYCDLDERAAREDVPRPELPGWRDWHDRNGKLIDRVRSALEDETVEDVLESLPDIREHLRQWLETAEERQAQLEEEVRVAQGTGESLREDEFVVLAAVSEDDYTIRCKGDIVEHDLVRWRTIVEPDLSADSGEPHAGVARFVRFEGAFIERTAGRTAKDDRCTVDVRRRSDGGPCGEMEFLLGTLMAGGCARMFTDDEGERMQREEKRKWQLDRDRKAVLKQELQQKQRQKQRQKHRQGLKQHLTREQRQELERKLKRERRQDYQQDHQQEHTQGIYWRMRL